MSHTVEFRQARRRNGLGHVFWAKCSCGASSGLVSAAGMCHGWEAEHKDEHPDD